MPFKQLVLIKGLFYEFLLFVFVSISMLPKIAHIFDCDYGLI